MTRKVIPFLGLYGHLQEQYVQFLSSNERTEIMTNWRKKKNRKTKKVPYEESIDLIGTESSLRSDFFVCLFQSPCIQSLPKDFQPFIQLNCNYWKYCLQL